MKIKITPIFLLISAFLAGFMAGTEVYFPLVVIASFLTSYLAIYPQQK